MSDIQTISQGNYILSNDRPDTMYTSGLEYDGDKISGYAGSAFKAGDEFPQSATDAIETVSANSGAWGGSALPISAGPGIKLEMVNNTLVASTDETVLFETDSISGVSSLTCSETVKNFERIAVLPSRFATTLGGGS